jgi:hypothetical protein
MFYKTGLSVDSSILDLAIQSIPNIDFRLALNQPTGRFFYDKWKIKKEFENTPWESILNSLPDDIGEARLIKLDPGTNYRSHADIDDRYHLSIISDRSFYINLEDNVMYLMPSDGNWYMAHAGIRHSAVNFGFKSRIQLVVRKLLNPGTHIKSPIKLKINPIEATENIRFIFDDTISPFLNKYSKEGLITDFEWENFEVKLTLDSNLLEELQSIASPTFKVSLI